jgi:hypothetical protein
MTDLEKEILKRYGGYNEADEIRYVKYGALSLAVLSTFYVLENMGRGYLQQGRVPSLTEGLIVGVIVLCSALAGTGIGAIIYRARIWRDIK